MQIKVAKNPRLIGENRARSAAKRRLKCSDPKAMQVSLCYKKMYFIKIMTLASRAPFPPKKRPYVVFYDSFIEAGGLTDGLPEYDVLDIADAKILPDRVSAEKFKSMQDELIEKYVLKQYLLKRPEVVPEGTEEIYLPYYRCVYGGGKTFVNAATGKLNL